MYKDNKSCISWAADGKTTTEHIGVRYHVCRDILENREVELKYCPMIETMADTITKLLCLNRLETIKEILPTAATALGNVTQEVQKSENGKQGHFVEVGC